MAHLRRSLARLTLQLQGPVSFACRSSAPWTMPPGVDWSSSLRKRKRTDAAAVPEPAVKFEAEVRPRKARAAKVAQGEGKVAEQVASVGLGEIKRQRHKPAQQQPTPAQDDVPAARKPRQRAKPAQAAPLPIPVAVPVPVPSADATQAAWTEATLAEAMQQLAKADQKLAGVIEQHSEPPAKLLARSDKMFGSLVRSIIYQQLAGNAAAAIHGRFLTACKCGPTEVILPEAVLAAPTPDLRAAGLSERKAQYLQDLSRFFAEGLLSDDAIHAMEDEMLIAELAKVKGIGRWSVDMFAMFHLGRPDVLPVGDLGVRKGMQTLYGLKELPDAAKMEEVSQCWRPYRSLGSYLMWQVPTAVQSKKPRKKPAKLAATAMPNMG